MYAYRAESQVKVVLCNSEGSEEIPFSELKDDYKDTIRHMIKEDQMEDGEDGLANYLNHKYETFNHKIESIEVTLTDNKAETVTKANQKLTEKEIEELKYYILGQFSDGWGENEKEIELGQGVHARVSFWERGMEMKIK